MAVSKDQLIKLVALLPEENYQSAFDYLQFLNRKQVRPDWDDIDSLEPDDVPLSEEERQLKNNRTFLSWEEAMNELNLPTDIKP